ncbi:MAG: cell envelope integrity protein TolA [Aurantimonas endophytica]|uniref:Colicin import membrane protein n=1 Tax=Aurantimonas endophytica TaxID=1522175 RepID=A0A7W6MNT4_9HYPH|nr:cell envelope integrity protein TolA [Aurantimonas endophytica]MBB4002210.1 colicin import membrane protein [Aurantimonas endophytica]MCO6402161.1 hypothetical protein [Aurantimonas endophytica]
MTSSPIWKFIFLAAVSGFAATAAHAQQPVVSIEAQVMRCWTSPSADPAASVRPITFTLHLDPDGNLLEARTDYVPANAVERTLRDAAVRAMRRCRPLRPPAAPYEEWRETTVTFDMVRATRSPDFLMPD